MMNHYKERVNARLDAALNQQDVRCEKIKNAMRYSVLNDGKRIRPLLVYCTGTALGATLDMLDNAACAIELIHSYSLIHDDLPAMDNATLRRGKPTCHIAFDEATAILAGDALQPLAAELLLDNAHIPNAEQRMTMTTLLMQASGAAGMVDGQGLEMSLTQQPNAAELETIYWRKTGALLVASVKLGAIAAGLTDAEHHHALDQFAHDLGFAFQIHDDILDIEGDAALIGKDKGLDKANEKYTYPVVFGIVAAKEKVNNLTESALKQLSLLPYDTHELRELAEFLVTRKS